MAINILKIILMTTLLIGCEENAGGKQTEVENSKQLKEEVMKELVNQLKPKDTLFIVTSRILGVCGNDERYDGVTTPQEKLEENKYIRENPYYVDVQKDYLEKYVVGKSVVITGSAFDNEFSSTLVSFNNDSLKVKKNVYDIQFTDVKKDTVTVSGFDFINNKNALQFKMVLRNSRWKVLLET